MARLTERFSASWQPGAWRWMDLLTVFAYLVIMLVGISVFALAIPGIEYIAPLVGSTPEDFKATLDLGQGHFTESHLAAVNFINYAVLATLAVISAWRPLVNGFRYFARHGVLKIIALPVIWFVSIMVSAGAAAALGADPSVSQNQDSLNSMITNVPFITMYVMAGLLGPFVEEYIFRHLLIGKLSRLLSVWVTIPLSAVSFALLHFISDPNIRLETVVPYLVLGIAISLTYTFSRFNLTYGYLLHVIQNTVALVMSYSLFGSYTPTGLAALMGII